ncbi:MAG: hypothetical protein ABIN58_11770 [candidate division WOR-3 bacterium]
MPRSACSYPPHTGQGCCRENRCSRVTPILPSLLAVVYRLGLILLGFASLRRAQYEVEHAPQALLRVRHIHLLDDDLRIYIMGDYFRVVEKEQYGAAVHVPLPKSKLTLSYAKDQQFWGRMHDDSLKEHLRRNQTDITKYIRIIGGGATADFDNVSVDRFGAEYVLEAGWLPTQFLKSRNPKLAFRGGYYHWNSPLPEKKLGDDFDSDADVYSGGLGFTLDRKGRKFLQDPTTRRQFSVDINVQYFDIEKNDYKLQYDQWGGIRGRSSVYYYHTEGEILNTGLQLTWWN